MEAAVDDDATRRAGEQLQARQLVDQIIEEALDDWSTFAKQIEDAAKAAALALKQEVAATRISKFERGRQDRKRVQSIRAQKAEEARLVAERAEAQVIAASIRATVQQHADDVADGADTTALAGTTDDTWQEPDSQYVLDRQSGAPQPVQPEPVQPEPVQPEQRPQTPQQQPPLLQPHSPQHQQPIYRPSARANGTLEFTFMEPGPLGITFGDVAVR